MDDLSITKDVEAELQWEPSVNAAAIAVAVKDGIVTLRGHVSSYAERMAVARAAHPLTCPVSGRVSRSTCASGSRSPMASPS